MKVLVSRQKQFNRRLAVLRRSGGAAARAADQADAIVGRLCQGLVPEKAGRVTKHGESRIKGCLKYDLSAAHRMVVLRHPDAIWLLEIGSHDEVDRWLRANRGLTAACDKRTKKLTLVVPGADHEVLAATPARKQLTEKFLLDLLASEDLNRLKITPSAQLRLARLSNMSSDEELESVAEQCGADDHLILGILLALREDDVEAATAAIRLSVGDALALDAHPEILAEALASPINSEEIVDLGELGEEELKMVLGSKSFRDWMLYLHPDQRRIVDEDYDDVALLQGISGSGKTSVLVHRAKRLAKDHPSSRIGIFTLNGSLAALIRQLVDTICSAEVASRIDVRATYELWKEIASYYLPKHPLQVHDHRSDETLEDCWLESYHRAEQQEVLEPLIRSLDKRGNIDPQRYLRDEFLWIRSGFAPEGMAGRIQPRQVYADPTKAPRVGRAIQFSADWRQRVIAALDFYEEWLSEGGFVDPAALALKAAESVWSIAKADSPFKYRCVLVDEVQDLGVVELDLLNAITEKGVNRLFFTGDWAQQVYPKLHSFPAANVKITHRRYFRKNYRNPKEILEAATKLSNTYPPPKPSDLPPKAHLPKYSSRTSAKPIVIACETYRQEVEFISHFVRHKRAIDDHPICVILCGLRDDEDRSLRSIASRMSKFGLDAQLLQRESIVESGMVFLSPLETAKGFEFSLVIVARCSAEHIPGKRQPEEEHWRDATHLYVAMTRARDELVLTHTGKASRFITCLEDSVYRRHAREEDPDLAPAFGSAVPQQTMQEKSGKTTSRNEDSGLFFLHQPGVCRCCGSRAMQGDWYCYSCSDT